MSEAVSSGFWVALLGQIGMQNTIVMRWRALLRGAVAICAAWVIAAAGGASAAPSFTLLYSFAGSGGSYPGAGLIRDSSGNLYGTTEFGGASGGGTVFKLTPSGSGAMLHSFKGGGDGFDPVGGLIADSAGNLYGTTSSGGAFGHGTVFKLSPAGSETVLYSFTGGKDGGDPLAELIADASGNLYGTAQTGGTSGYGVVFKLTPTGTETVVYSFKGGADGAYPTAGLYADASGNLYGTTAQGGGKGCFGAGCGVVFKVAPGGTEIVLHAFTGGSDGVLPLARLLADGGGNLYGTTYFGGGTGCGGHGCGTVYKVTPGGLTTILHTFGGKSDGILPLAGLIADVGGNLYGTTEYGGGAGCSGGGCGVVFKLAPDGSETVLYRFSGGTAGIDPAAGLIADSAGNLYGTTAYGGTAGYGMAFELSGTGFVTAGVPFSFFSSKLTISSTAYFQLLSNITLGSVAPPLNPPAQPVTIAVGSFSTTIPVGSFVASTSGEWDFDGAVAGVAIHARIWVTGTKQYLVLVKAMTALPGVKNPVPVTVTIGPNTGSASVTAAIFAAQIIAPAGSVR